MYLCAHEDDEVKNSKIIDTLAQMVASSGMDSHEFFANYVHVKRSILSASSRLPVSDEDDVELFETLEADTKKKLKELEKRVQSRLLDLKGYLNEKDRKMVELFRQIATCPPEQFEDTYGTKIKRESDPINPEAEEKDRIYPITWIHSRCKLECDLNPTLGKFSKNAKRGGRKDVVRELEKQKYIRKNFFVKTSRKEKDQNLIEFFHQIVTCDPEKFEETYGKEGIERDEKGIMIRGKKIFPVTWINTECNLTCRENGKLGSLIAIAKAGYRSKVIKELIEKKRYLRRCVVENQKKLQSGKEIEKDQKLLELFREIATCDPKKFLQKYEKHKIKREKDPIMHGGEIIFRITYISHGCDLCADMNPKLGIFVSSAREGVRKIAVSKILSRKYALKTLFETFQGRKKRKKKK